MNEAVGDGIKVFEYSSKDFVKESTPWPEDNEPFVKSKFDSYLCCAWEEDEKDNVFWYNLDEVKRKTLPGKYEMLAQLNAKRFAQRRKPEEAKAVVMPFDPNKFHFNKIKNTEVLFQLKRKDETKVTDRIIINVSPIEYGHVLIIPQYKDCLPQVLTAYSIQVSAEICLLTAHRGFCVGFNSLCALASVNHLHLHAMYISYCLPIVTAVVKRFMDNIFILDNYMVNGYALQLVDDGVISFSRDVIRITSYLSNNNIAHNVVMCRRDALQVSINHINNSYVTVFIFPKRPSPETTGDPFNCAFLEVAGFLPMRDSEEYENMTEITALNILGKYTYSTEEFENLSEQLMAAIKT